MDVNDVTGQYDNLLEGQKQTLLQAKQRQGQRPHDREPRDLMYFKFMMNQNNQAKATQHKGQIHTSFLPPPYLPCTEPLESLRPITIRELQIETHHRGTYLALRTFTQPTRMTAVIALAEDEHDDAVILQLYQQELEETRKAGDIIDVGTILLVKEPYFKVVVSGGYGLRIDHLSDVVYITKDDPKIPSKWRSRVAEATASAQVLKARGNAAVGKENYWQAIAEYSKALEQPATADEIEIIKRNRSLAYLKTHQYDAALSDTGFPEFTPQPAEKALFRAAEALYRLERYKDSTVVLDLLHANSPDNKSALDTLARAKRRHSEQEKGDYDFRRMQAEAKKLRPPRLDHATYVGPVEVRKAGSKGRGLFLTKAVKAGDLLLCEKAFAHAYAEPDDGLSRVALLMNLETKQGFMGGQADLITIIAQKLFRNPSTSPSFRSLYHGDYEAASTTKVDGKPIVDTFLIDRTMSLNVFGCPASSSLITYKNGMSKSPGKPKAYNSCGIWTQASYINHKCVSNARRAFIGDMMIVRATRDLEADTEVTFWYKPPDHGTSKDALEAYKSWGFVCDCAMCVDVKLTKIVTLKEREKILADLTRVCEASIVQTDQIQRLIEALNRTYTKPAEEVPRLLVWDPQLLLTRVYMSQQKMKKALESVGKVLVALGFIVEGADVSSASFRIVKWGLLQDHLVEVLIHGRNAFAALGAVENSLRAEEYARTVYKIVVGEDSFFEATYCR